MNENWEILRKIFNSKKRIWIFAVLVALIIGAIAANNIYLKILELEEIGGLSSIYVKNMIWKIAIGFAAGALAFAGTLIQNTFIRRNVKKIYVRRGMAPGRFFNWIPAIIAGLIFGFGANSSMYLNAMKYFNSFEFNLLDPLFSNDTGYYIFTRPFLMNLVNYFQGLVVFLFFYMIIYYAFILFSINKTVSMEDFKYRPIMTHGLSMIALFLAVRFPAYRFKAESILFGKVVESTGAGFVDVNVWLKYYRIIPFVLVVIVVAAMFFLFRKKYKPAVFSLLVFPAAFIATAIIALAVQGLVVEPNEKDKEAEYLAYNMQMTRYAYGLDKIQEINIENVEVLTPDMLEENKETIEDIRTMDYKSAIRTNTQIQSNTLFYTFVDGDIVNYEIGGRQRPIFISARELAPNQLPDNSYINRIYRYTHGYGIVINPINKTNEQGQIEFIMSGLDHISDYANLQVQRPEIYYGELTDRYAVVDANSPEDMEINKDGNEETRYEGKGGIKLSLVNRLLYAAKLGDLKMLTSTYAKDATLLINRQVVERVQMGVPFLEVDPDPYILLTEEGGLVWVLDAYTTADNFPYSQDSGRLNYIRNSVKIVIDAYDGKVEYHIIDEEDPVINAYDSIYPGIFKRGQLPEIVKDHMKYPEALFELQTEMLKKYHLQPEEVDKFYSQQDLWDIAKYPAEQNSGATRDIDSYYVSVSLPSVSNEAELILMRPFTPKSDQRHNMVAWLNVRNSLENYGELILYNYPKDINMLGPNQIEVKINQIDSISKNMTLWGQGGSDVYKGSLLVIPIGNSVLYIEPIYIEAAGTASIPEVRQVITGYQIGDQFVYGIGDDVEQALADMFDLTGEETDEEPGEDGGVIDMGTLEELKKKVDELQEYADELKEFIESLMGE